MANTLKFGNGQWATGNGTALAYNDENSNFKPLPFDFTRASSGTVVNQSGLIETVGSGLPRIDFLGNTKGALLLEPSRSNSIPFSEDFSQSAWTKSGTSVVSGFASPSADAPLGAYKLVESTANSAHTITSNVTSVTSGATTTKSIIVKPNGRRWIVLLEIYKPSSRAWFDLELGVVGSLQSSAISSNIEKLSNGYFRCSVTSAVNSTFSQLRMDIVTDNNITTGYQGDGVSGVYIFGAQLEEGSYATSYIPTSGSAVTRVAETCSNGGNEQVINSTEGTIYFEGKSLIASLSYNYFLALSDGTNNNRLELRQSGTVLQFLWRIGGVYQNQILSSGLTITNNMKFALKYSSAEIAFWINGAEMTGTIATPTLFPANTLTELAFDDGGGGNPFQGNCKDIRVYNEALTDLQLQTLTTL